MSAHLPFVPESTRRARQVRGSLSTLVLAPLLLAAGPLSAGFAGTDVFVPAVARAEGAGGSQFYSTVWVTNLSASSPAAIRAELYQRDQSNTSPLVFTDTVAPGETKRYDNAVQSLFGLSGVSGALHVTSPGEVLVSSRTYNLPSSGAGRDTTGLFFGAVPSGFAIGQGETTSLQGVSQGGSDDFRYNFGIVETAGESVTVRVTLKDASGQVAGSRDYDLRPREPKQLNVTDVAPGLSTTNSRLEARVTAGNGKVILYGTQIANGSQDSSGFEMSFKSSLLSTGAAGVTSLNGLTGSLSLLAGAGTTITEAGSGITIASTGLALPYAGSSSDSLAFYVTNTAAGTAMAGQSSSGTAVSGSTSGGVAVRGSAASGVGVYGTSEASRGVFGASSDNVGVYAATTSGTALVAFRTGGGDFAGRFFGNVDVSGTLTKTAGFFKIDHPLDPDGKYLYHSFVESPDMKNIYDGTVVLGAGGEAVVELPAWFEALNEDFRYQLTPIGAPAAGLYVAEEVSDNRFKIAGGRRGLKVSWQVTGTRRDAYAKAHRRPVEEDKPVSEGGLLRLDRDIE